MESFKQEFQIEVGTQIDAIFHDLAELELQLDHGPTRRSLIAAIFRKIHTLKGSASTAGFEPAAKIAQAVETVLDKTRSGEVVITTEVVSSMVAGVSAIAETLQLDSIDAAIARAQSATEQLLKANNSHSGYAEDSITHILSNLPSDVARSLTPQDRQRLKENISEGAQISVLTIVLDLDSFDDRFREISAQLNDHGEILTTLPGIDAGLSDTINFRILYAAAPGAEGSDSVVDWIGRASISSFNVLTIPSTLDTNHNTLVRADVTGIETNRASETDDGRDQNSTVSNKQRLVTVSLSNLKEVLLVGSELAATGISAIESILSGEIDAKVRAELESCAIALRAQSDRFEKSAYRISTVSLKRSFSRAEVIGRSAARQAGKSVHFCVESENVRVDAGLASVINDSLLHLINNAISHGIEDDATRTAIGKPLPGEIVLRARIENGSVNVSVSDDGAGLDFQKIAKIAIAKGHVAPGSAISEKECFDLITQPGFTTSDSVSRVAGRGVGLDAVRRLVENVSGHLNISTEPFVGTTFELTFSDVEGPAKESARNHSEMPDPIEP